MENEGSINAIAAMMRDKTPIELGCGREDKDRKGRLGEGEREKRVLAFRVSLDYRIKVLPLSY